MTEHKTPGSVLLPGSLQKGCHTVRAHRRLLPGLGGLAGLPVGREEAHAHTTQAPGDRAHT